MDLANQIIFVAALLFLFSIVASAGASRIGAPLLLVFLVLGMLAGEDGPGGIRFNDFRITYIVGSIALAVILFDGGLRTKAESFRAGLRPALALATLGVLITAALTGAFAAWVLDLDLTQGLLVGAIVGSTDAAAVFSLLHSHGMELKRRVAATLEIESGSNDPMAIFLTVALVDLLARGGAPSWSLAWLFVQQMGLGVLLGLAGGRALAWLVNRLPLAPGLYPLLALAGGLFVFAATAMLGGSGFLAIYVAGLVLGNQRLRAADNILRVHDGIAWLGQITMFLVLGLLVTPSELVKLAPAALAIALVLMLVARPLAVWLSLLPFRFPRSETAFISWVGLRGAVPIVLALFPFMAGLEEARLYFNIAFFVVLVSLIVQGWTVAPLARRLGLELPPTADPVQRVELELAEDSGDELVAFRVSPGSLAAGSRLERAAAGQRHAGDRRGARRCPAGSGAGADRAAERRGVRLHARRRRRRAQPRIHAGARARGAARARVFRRLRAGRQGQPGAGVRGLRRAGASGALRAHAARDLGEAIQGPAGGRRPARLGRHRAGGPRGGRWRSQQGRPGDPQAARAARGRLTALTGA